MCDYSLELYRSRPATQEEQYTLHRFPSGTMGFVAGTDCETAVCMPAGARLSLQGINETVQRAFSIGPAEVVTMTRLEVTGHAHRDAVRFGNGREVLLQSLNAGVTCTLAPRDLDKVLGLETTTPELVEA
ncbi:MAG TPA: hypothetical protein VE527_24195 [Reyranella sp.]|jgi:hypothetical protein|nr:hypothetical protein [Reyranella sp.]